LYNISTQHSTEQSSNAGVGGRDPEKIRLCIPDYYSYYYYRLLLIIDL